MATRFALAFVLALTFSGCSQIQAVGAGNAPISSIAPQEFNAAKKALTAAHLVHKATADFLVLAAQSDLCHAACAVQARSLLDQSEAILKAADAAVVTGDAKTIEDKIAAATGLVGQLTALVGKK